MMKPNIGISEKDLKAISTILSAALADEMVLYIKTRKFHWNVSGESFMELHKLFEGQYQELEEAVDAIAERINKLGSPTPGTMKEFLSMATLEESLEKSLTSKKMIEQLLQDHETVCVELRKNIAKCSGPVHDVGTADFLTGLLEAHETTAWKLRRYIG